MKVYGKLILLGIMALIVLPACQQRAVKNQARMQTAAPVPPSSPPLEGHAHINDAAVIPSAGSPKVHTTNEHGGTSYGMGSSVYSMIGSSGLHSDGLSSHLESRLSGAGINDVKVLAVDDMVILAAENRRPTASRYDAVQQKVLSNTGGISARGPEPGKPIATTGAGPAGDDNLDMAEMQIRQFLGANVKVLKVTGAKAVETIDRIRTNGNGSPVSPEAMSDNIRTLLKQALSENK